MCLILRPMKLHYMTAMEKTMKVIKRERVEVVTHEFYINPSICYMKVKFGGELMGKIKTRKPFRRLFW